MRALRAEDLEKPPGVAETIDWAHALTVLGRDELDEEVAETTLGSLLKVREDVEALREGRLASLVADALAVSR